MERLFDSSLTKLGISQLAFDSISLQADEAWALYGEMCDKPEIDQPLINEMALALEWVENLKEQRYTTLMIDYTEAMENGKPKCCCVDFPGDNKKCPIHGNWYPASEGEAEDLYYRNKGTIDPKYNGHWSDNPKYSGGSIW